MRIGREQRLNLRRWQHHVHVLNAHPPSRPLPLPLSTFNTQNHAAKTVAKKALAAVTKPFKAAGKATRKAAAALRSAAAKRRRGAAGVAPALPPFVPPPAPATPVVRDHGKTGPTPTERTAAFVMLWLAKQPSPPRDAPAGVAAATLTLLASCESDPAARSRGRPQAPP